MVAAMPDFSADHFALFGLPRAQRVEGATLDRRFRQLQAEVHPDRHVQAGVAGRRLSMQWATRVNEAYQTLKSPGARARYLLGLLGHDPQVESNTAMPTDFLMDQMALREAVTEARHGNDAATLDATRQRLSQEIAIAYERLAELIDTHKDFQAATGLARQLMFQEKLLDEIDDALETVTF